MGSAISKPGATITDTLDVMESVCKLAHQSRERGGSGGGSGNGSGATGTANRGGGGGGSSNGNNAYGGGRGVVIVKY